MKRMPRSRSRVRSHECGLPSEDEKAHVTIDAPKAGSVRWGWGWTGLGGGGAWVTQAGAPTPAKVVVAAARVGA